MPHYDEATLAIHATQAFDNPAFQRAVTATRNLILSEFASSKLDEKLLREACYLKLQALEDIVNYMGSYMAGTVPVDADT